jgi:two-component system chemotaxis response regulator CheB
MAPSQLIGILMTGMGNDGAEAMALIHTRGGRTIAEAEETAVVWGMPRELIMANGASFVVPLQKIAAQLKNLVR